MALTSSPAGKPQVLIVDDEPDMLDFMERVLRREFRVTVTSDAEEALRRLAEGSYDVLITDHQMPKISGLQLLEKTEKSAPDMVRIVISGFAEAPDILAAVEAGEIHNYILKPVDSRKLLMAIEQAYARRAGADTSS